MHLLRTIVGECLRCAMNVHPTVALQVRAEPDRRVGAAVLVLGTLWSNIPGDVLLEMLQKRLPEGAVRRCPAALARLDSGRGEVAVQGFNSQIRVGTRATFAS